MLLASLPYIAGYRAQDSDHFFNGTVYNRLDYSGYLATMRQVMRTGDWAYHFPFTSEPQKGAYVRLSYVALGQIARITGLGIVPTERDFLALTRRVEEPDDPSSPVFAGFESGDLRAGH